MTSLFAWQFGWQFGWPFACEDTSLGKKFTEISFAKPRQFLASEICKPFQRFELGLRCLATLSIVMQMSPHHRLSRPRRPKDKYRFSRLSKTSKTSEAARAVSAAR